MKNIFVFFLGMVFMVITQELPYIAFVMFCMGLASMVTVFFMKPRKQRQKAEAN
jgi:hypothetical protein